MEMFFFTPWMHVGQPAGLQQLPRGCCAVRDSQWTILEPGSSPLAWCSAIALRYSQQWEAGAPWKRWVCDENMSEPGTNTHSVEGELCDVTWNGPLSTALVSNMRCAYKVIMLLLWRDFFCWVVSRGLHASTIMGQRFSFNSFFPALHFMLSVLPQKALVVILTHPVIRAAGSLLGTYWHTNLRSKAIAQDMTLALDTTQLWSRVRF